MSLAEHELTARPRRALPPDDDPEEDWIEPARARRDNPVLSLGKGIVETVAVVLAALLASVLVRTFVAQPFVVPTGSMQQTIELDNWVLASKFGGFKRGDVVVFKDPGGWLPDTPPPPQSELRRVLEMVGVLPDSSEKFLVKRIIGMPGDHVRCCTAEGRLEINGVAIDESAYIYGGPEQELTEASHIPFDVVVPEGRIFVLGDHRTGSRDSRCHLGDAPDGQPPGSKGFVPTDNVVGATVAIISPLDRLRPFHVPEVFEQIPPPMAPAPKYPVMNLAPASC